MMSEKLENCNMDELNSIENINIDDLYKSISILIENSKKNVATSVNKEMTLLYWNIGKDITDNVLKNQKAEYGKEVIKKLSQRLVIEYGRGYGERNLFRILKFYDYFPDFEILSTLSAKLSWSHFVELLQIQDKYEKAKGEEPPIAIILCASKNDMMAELLELDDSGIHVAQYLTEYVPKEILEQKFIDSIERAKVQLEQRKNNEDTNIN